MGSELASGPIQRLEVNNTQAWWPCDNRTNKNKSNLYYCARQESGRLHCDISRLSFDSLHIVGIQFLFAAAGLIFPTVKT